MDRITVVAFDSEDHIFTTHSPEEVLKASQGKGLIPLNDPNGRTTLVNPDRIMTVFEVEVGAEESE
jgi:hypothetical protein